MKKQKISTQLLEKVGELFDKPEFIEDRLAVCPQSPGVYLMKNHLGQVIYVGKAKNLRSRVKSYFQNSQNHSAKTQHLVGHVQDIEFLIAQSETEALLLENTLIKKWKPKYNILLKDDKTYPYVKIDKKHAFPRAYIARKVVRDDGALYFGPYVQGSEAHLIVSMASKVFRLRDCRDFEFSNRSRPCLSYEIGQCTAPCVSKVTPGEYKKQLRDFETFIKKGSVKIQKLWEEEMATFSENLQFEEAAKLRDRIKILSAIGGSTASVVSQTDIEDKDVWNIWPQKWDTDLSQEETSDEIILCGVFYFRAGKWMGQTIYTLEWSELLNPENFWPQILLSHYSKKELPVRILVPDTEKFPEQEHYLEALVKISKPKTETISELANTNREEAQSLPLLSLVHEKESWLRLFELTTENMKSRYEETLQLRSRRTQELTELKDFLGLSDLPRHMECIDISNFQGSANVASAVVFKDGRPQKSEYRHYSVRGFEGQNDFESFKEIISRRYGKPDSPKPDLLVVDGGKGQLSSVMMVLKELGRDFPVIGLAKARTQSDFRSDRVRVSEERVFFPGQKNEAKIKAPGALKLLTHIRDEAHRFAIEFNRLKMNSRE